MPACTSRQLAEMKMEIIRQLTVFKLLPAGPPATTPKAFGVLPESSTARGRF